MATKYDNLGLGYAYYLPTAGWTTRIRNCLSQSSELFSEFNKYIAPTYYHDRCERSLSMKLYSMHKREFVLVFFMYFLMLSLGMFIGLAGPPITSTTAVKGSQLLTHCNLTQANIATGPFNMNTTYLTTYSQQLWIIVKVKTENNDDETFDKSFQTAVMVDGFNDKQKLTPIVGSLANRTRHLRCKQQNCDEFITLHLGFLDFNYYTVKVHFYGLESFHQRYNIQEVSFYFKTYNPAFTQIEIWFRFIFLFGTFIISGWFAHSLRKYAVFDWSMEQKWMSVLLPLLLFYNNPLFPMMFLVNSWIPGLLDAALQITFIAALLLFWLCIYHGLRQTERRWLGFYLPKLIIVGMLWLPSIVISICQKYNEMLDPTYNHQEDTETLKTWEATLFIFGAIYVVYLVFLILKSYSELKSMPYFDMRLKFLTMLMLVVIAITITVTSMRFGFDVLEDNFVAQLSTHYSSSAQFMSFYGLLNFYIYTMTYVYSPDCRNIHDSMITKDNPTFSMINDSDEEVMFGSDEESRRPLNRNRTDDDSD